MVLVQHEPVVASALPLAAPPAPLAAALTDALGGGAAPLVTADLDTLAREAQ